MTALFWQLLPNFTQTNSTMSAALQLSRLIPFVVTCSLLSLQLLCHILFSLYYVTDLCLQTLITCYLGFVRVI